MKMSKKFFWAFMVVLAVFAAPVAAYASSRVVSTSGGNRIVTYIEVRLDETYTVRGLSAHTLFGRPTATITEFAEAVSGQFGTDTIFFPANFFNTGGDLRIVGGIFSDGRVISHDPYFDRAIGFTPQNRMAIFHGAPQGRYMYTHRRGGERLPYTTAFNPFPHLIMDGHNLRLAPSPGVTQEFLDNRVHRAFMGQRADGTLVVGNVGGTNMFELQEIAAAFELVNATNIDGGASASIWRNGTYIARPGRQLASLVFITNDRAGGVQPQRIPAGNEVTVIINGVVQNFDVSPQLIDGRTMLPLRAIGEALGMEVRFDDGTNTAILTAPGVNITHRTGTPIITVNATPRVFDTPSMVIEGRTLVPLRMLAEAIGADVRWDSATRTATIVTN